MASLNKVQLIGNLGKDPERKQTQNGVSVCTFSLATTDHWKDADGERRESTEWHNIVAWKQTADIIAQYARKGDRIYIEGKLTTRSYEDKEGNKRYVTEVQASNVILLSPRSDDGEKSPSAPERSRPAKAAPAPVADDNEPDDDLPF